MDTDLLVGWFNSSVGDMFSWKTDGTFHALKGSAPPSYDSGPLYEQVTTWYAGGDVSLTLRLPADSNHSEVTVSVRPSLRLGKGKQMLAVRFRTDLNSSGRFYTDSNGMGLLMRAQGKAGVSTFPAVSYR